MGDCYTSMFTGHFLWPSLGSIICPQINKHSEFPKLKAFVTSFLTTTKKKNKEPYSFNKVTVTYQRYIKWREYLEITQTQWEQVKALFIDLVKTVIFIITTAVRVSHSLLRVSQGGSITLAAEQAWARTSGTDTQSANIIMGCL